MKLSIKLLSDTAKKPVYATPGAACFDLHAEIGINGELRGCPEDYRSDGYGANTMSIGTGIAVAVPEGYAMLVFSRSGHGFKENTRLANCVGVIDSDYRGEVKVKLARDDAAPIKVTHGDRIAQAMIVKAEQVEFLLCDELDSTERGEGGFGSTGQ